jgi:diguanylate cyclase (GGDEF)-like protein
LTDIQYSSERKKLKGRKKKQPIQKEDGLSSSIKHILLIEDNPDDIRLIQWIMAGIRNSQFKLECVDRLKTALKRLAKHGIDVILMDLGLPDSQGIDTLRSVYNKAPKVPMVVLTNLGDEKISVQAIQEGAQDYLIKGQVNSDLLKRTLMYAIERKRAEEELRAQSLKDELTGLNNRRGFFVLAQQQIKLAKRKKMGFYLLFADLDGMKWINDNLGHHEGDKALKEIADVFRKTFRESDIIARIGGDEFAILAIEAQKNSVETLSDRLQKRLKDFNEEQKYGFELSLSIGVAYYDPEHPAMIGKMLEQADKLMYEQKQSKKKRGQI